MFYRICHFRRLTGYLAILALVMGSLQQSHAICYLTECDTASGQDECEACLSERTCSHSHEHQHEPEVDNGFCGSEVADHHSAPCEDRCWCCSPAEAVNCPKDETNGAEELLASSASIGTDYMMSLPGEQLVALFDSSAFRDSDTLSAVQFCVQLCRFRI